MTDASPEIVSQEQDETGYGDIRQVANCMPIHELGSVFVLTQLQSAPISVTGAVENLVQAAREVGWQPVGDVLRSAIERSLERGHLLIDARQRLAITASGKQWLGQLLAQNFGAGPICCSDMLRFCQSQSAGRRKQSIVRATKFARRNDRLPRVSAPRWGG